MTSMYGESANTGYEDSPVVHNSLAQMWTPDAQQRYAFLKSLPSEILSAANARGELGYLEGYKKAAERKGAN